MLCVCGAIEAKAFATTEENIEIVMVIVVESTGGALCAIAHPEVVVQRHQALYQTMERIRNWNEADIRTG